MRIMDWSSDLCSSDLDYIVGPKLNVGISASRDVTSSAAIDSSYQISRILGVYANYRLGTRTSIQVGASDAKRRFRGQFDNPLYPTLPERGTEKTRQYHASATYSPTERWKVDRKRVVSGKRVSVCVDLGGRRIIKKKKTNT